MRAAAAAAACTLALAGCGGSEEGSTDAPPARDRGVTDITVGTTELPQGLRHARCPGDEQNCAEASGTVIFVERVDPDGDGDAHFVLRSDDGITAPGVSVIDVPAALRPDPLPKLGDAVSAAGPVYRGSYGQHQIQATELHTAPRP